ncbi:hypothetical protein SEA_LILAS_34 [Gordonia phage Lilas]|nr:hypothetical protein SEA_LILAS_34 [Gordonia phage Lilas]
MIISDGPALPVMGGFSRPLDFAYGLARGHQRPATGAKDVIMS